MAQLPVRSNRDGSVSVTYREMIRAGYDPRCDLFRAVFENGGPDWACDPATCDIENDEDGARLYPLFNGGA